MRLSINKDKDLALLFAKYAFLFSCIVKLYEERYGDVKSSTSIKAVKEAFEKLVQDGYLNKDFIENTKSVIKEYKDLLVNDETKAMAKEMINKAKATVDALSMKIISEIKKVYDENNSNN